MIKPGRANAVLSARTVAHQGAPKYRRGKAIRSLIPVEIQRTAKTARRRVSAYARPRRWLGNARAFAWSAGSGGGADAIVEAEAPASGAAGLMTSGRLAPGLLRRSKLRRAHGRRSAMTQDQGGGTGHGHDTHPRLG